jgi:predicted nucleotidyltransferase
MTDFERLIRTLVEGRVEFIIIGGLAATAHGSARLTQDVDVVYARSRENVRRLVDALRSLAPYPRGAPPDLPFAWDEATVRRGLNFTLTTAAGDLDLLGEVTGGGSYETLESHTEIMDFFGCACRCLDLPTLIKVKRAAGRPKDFESVAELEALLEERERSPRDQSS